MDFKLNSATLGFMTDQLGFVMSTHNQLHPGTPAETGQFVVDVLGNQSPVCPISEGYDKGKSNNDWICAQQAAIQLAKHRKCSNLLDRRLRKDPIIRRLIKMGARAIAVGDVVIGGRGPSRPELTEALILSVFNAFDLIGEVQIRGNFAISGVNPRIELPFRWKGRKKGKK